MYKSMCFSRFNVCPIAVEGYDLRVRNLSDAMTPYRPFCGRMVSFTHIPDTGVKDTTTAYRPSWRRILSFKFRKHLPRCIFMPWSWSTACATEIPVVHSGLTWSRWWSGTWYNKGLDLVQLLAGPSQQGYTTGCVADVCVRQRHTLFPITLQAKTGGS